jgi:hypothetical protein
LLLLGFPFGLAQGLELVLVEQGLLQALTQAFVEIIELADLQLPGDLRRPLLRNAAKLASTTRMATTSVTVLARKLAYSVKTP